MSYVKRIDFTWNVVAFKSEKIFIYGLIKWKFIEIVDHTEVIKENARDLMLKFASNNKNEVIVKPI